MGSIWYNLIGLGVDPLARNPDIPEGQEAILEIEMAILVEISPILEEIRPISVEIMAIFEVGVSPLKKFDSRKNSILFDKLVMTVQKVSHLLYHN